MVKNYIVISVVLLAVFMLDLLTPLGLAIGVMYVLIIVLTVGLRRIAIWWFAGATSVLTLLAAILLFDESTGWIPFANRAISILAIWTTAFVAAKNRKLEKERQHHAEKIEKSNRELTEFAYITTHDLQEPLRTISSYSQLLSRRYTGKLDENADLYLRFLQQASGRMKKLILDILEYSKLGKAENLSLIDCNEVMDEVLEDLQGAFHDREVKVEYENLPVLTGYHASLKRLFQNLLSNSLKFSDKRRETSIRVTAENSAEAWLFSVSDNGNGIHSDFHEKIFQMFHRLHPGGDQEGTGIGLAQCKKVVELHQGKIWLDSEPGKGSTFYFTIPHQIRP